MINCWPNCQGQSKTRTQTDREHSGAVATLTPDKQKEKRDFLEGVGLGSLSFLHDFLTLYHPKGNETMSKTKETKKTGTKQAEPKATKTAKPAPKGEKFIAILKQPGNGRVAEVEVRAKNAVEAEKTEEVQEAIANRPGYTTTRLKIYNAQGELVRSVRV